MKTIMFFLFTFIILNCKAQFVYVGGMYGVTEKKNNTGVHVGFQLRDKKRDNKHGFVAEFTAAAEPGKIIGGGSETKSPNLLFLHGGYTVSFGKLQLYGLVGVALYSIGYWTDQHEVINKITFPLVGSARVSYGSVFIQGNYLKNDAGIEAGFIFKFKKD